MRAALGDHQKAPVGGGELDRGMPAKSRRVRAQVEHHVVQGALQAGHDLGLGARARAGSAARAACRRARRRRGWPARSRRRCPRPASSSRQKQRAKKPRWSSRGSACSTSMPGRGREIRRIVASRSALPGRGAGFPQALHHLAVAQACRRRTRSRHAGRRVSCPSRGQALQRLALQDAGVVGRTGSRGSRGGRRRSRH